MIMDIINLFAHNYHLLLSSDFIKSPRELVSRFFVRYDTAEPMAAIITGLIVSQFIVPPEAIS